MYAKYINRHKVELFDSPVFVADNKIYVHPTPSIMKRYGYLPLHGEPPRDAAFIYVNEGDYITYHSIKEDPPT